MLTVYIPDTDPISLPDSGQSVEEIRRGLVAAGFAQLETAVATKDGDEITFERPQGGTKGL